MSPVRLRRVRGLEARHNDALFQPAADAHQQALVYFGGDVQDYPEAMQAHRDNRYYVKWNLENTARMLAHNFPAKHIVVVRPSRIEYKSFSCYDNFVPSNNAGVPDHTPTYSALLHLEKLLQGISHRLRALPTSELLDALSAPAPLDFTDIQELQSQSSAGADAASAAGAGADNPSESDEANARLRWRDALALDECRLTLVGFSKGCVVLNQLVYEFHYTKTLTPGDEHMVRLISRIEAMYWLDGGHAGGKNTWLTSRSLLETLAGLDVSVYVHVSPYQVQDSARPWIGREERAFTALLRKMGAKVQRYLHPVPPTGLMGLPGGVGGPAGGLGAHFAVLQGFKQLQDQAPAAPAPRPPSEDEDDEG